MNNSNWFVRNWNIIKFGTSINELPISQVDTLRPHFHKLLDIIDMCMLEEAYDIILSKDINMQKLKESKSCI